MIWLYNPEEISLVMYCQNQGIGNPTKNDHVKTYSDFQPFLFLEGINSIWRPHTVVL